MEDVILVTGGAGYVGSHLTRKLLARGYCVRVLDSFLYGDEGLRDVADHPALELITGDICDAEKLADAIRGTNTVVHLAALVGDGACDLHPERSMAINYHSTRQVLAACQDVGARRLVFASSCSVYGANGDSLLHERSHLNPVSLYARTRLMSEDLLFKDAGDVEMVVLRLATVCGVSPRMRFDLMVNTMTACATVQGAVRVTGGSQWRPHVHVQDAAEAFALAVETPGIGGEIFNVGSDQQNFRIAEVAEKVAAAVSGVHVQELNGVADRRSYRVTFDHIRTTLGFEPQLTVDDAINEVRDLLLSGAVVDFTEDRFHNAKWLSGDGHRRGAA